ncbi:MAG: cell division protein ZipA C-terminal FtsZ-binding domain-containing protein [Fimbriimonas sp.]
MNSGLPDLFGVPLKPDPAIALQPLQINYSPKSGPLHKVQYVIEFVGPRSMMAPAVSQLVSPEWHNALGQPEIYAMRPSDLHWQRLSPSQDGSYDSLALAWDFLGEQGNITSASAQHLLSFAERFSPHINRRAMPLPPPNDVDKVVKALLMAQENLDVGFSINILADNVGFQEKDLWIECAKLGLDFAPGGTFDYRTPKHPYPLLSVSPMGFTDVFSLGNVQKDTRHQGATVGFSVPLCIAPTQALEASFFVAEHIGHNLAGQVLDQDSRSLTERVKSELRQHLKAAVALYAELGITTGSQEALKLFGA